MKVIFQSILGLIMVPPVGLILMLISCSSRYYENTDILLGLLIPFYGFVMFWSCP